jgi:hypothetical protein
MSFAPVVLFTYNRPWHTEQTLNALMQNQLADQSTLFIHCDGPKDGATGEQLEKIQEVRKVVRKQKWCKDVFVIEQDKNLGLSKSIISNVTKTINQYGKIIVLEDDLIISPVFLKYMNTGLDVFEDDPEIASINGWMVPIKRMPQYFLQRGGDCWGWATWREKWKLFEEDASLLYEKLMSSPDYLKDYDSSWLDILKAQIDGKVDSWHIRWHTSLWINSQYGLFPGESMVENIGLDGSGTHSGVTKRKKYVPLKESFLAKDLYSITAIDSLRAAKKISLYNRSMKGSLIGKIARKLAVICNNYL